MVNLNWEKILDDRPYELKQKSRALEILELAVCLAVKGGCVSAESVFAWLTDIPQETFVNLWHKVYPDMVSKKYFDQVHGGYDQFISNRGTYFLRVCGGNKDMFMNRLSSTVKYTPQSRQD